MPPPAPAPAPAPAGEPAQPEAWPDNYLDEIKGAMLKGAHKWASMRHREIVKLKSRVAHERAAHGNKSSVEVAGALAEQPQLSKELQLEYEAMYRALNDGNDGA